MREVTIRQAVEELRAARRQASRALADAAHPELVRCTTTQHQRALLAYYAALKTKDTA